MNTFLEKWNGKRSKKKIINLLTGQNQNDMKNIKYKNILLITNEEYVEIYSFIFFQFF